MQLQQGATVRTAEGKDVGHLDRVVIDPKTKEVTHVVVRKGVLFTEDKVVPLSLIASTTKEEVRLREDAGDLDALPVYEETSYVPVDEEELMHTPASAAYAPAYYWYPYSGPVAAGWGERLYPAYPAVPPPGYTVEVKENIPEETVALKEGAKVVSRDGKHVGNVERVFTDPEADRATHFLVSKGLLLKEHKMIPADWVSSVSEDEIHLAVGSRLLEGLREYREPEHG